MEEVDRGLLRYWQYSFTNQANYYLSVYYVIAPSTLPTGFIHYVIFMINFCNKHTVTNYGGILNYKKRELSLPHTL